MTLAKCLLPNKLAFMGIGVGASTPFWGHNPSCGLPHPGAFPRGGGRGVGLARRLLSEAITGPESGRSRIH